MAARPSRDLGKRLNRDRRVFHSERMDCCAVIFGSSGNRVDVEPTRTPIRPRVDDHGATPSRSAAVEVIGLAIRSSVRRRITDQQQKPATEIPPLHFGTSFEYA